MAIHEQPRENLLREATAFTRRYRFAGDRVEVFWGVKESGPFSVYFDEQPVLQFTEEGALRRAFADDTRFAAEQGRLVKLMKPTKGGHVQLRREPLGETNQQSLLQTWTDLLEDFSSGLASGSFRLTGLSSSSAGIVEAFSDEDYRTAFAASIDQIAPMLQSALPLRVAKHH